MIDREKVMTWLEICGKNNDCSGCCPYSENGFGEYGQCRESLMADAYDLLKEHEHSGTWEWITEDEYRCSECKSVTCVDECMNEPQYLYCPYCGCKMTFEGNWVRRE